MSHLLRKKERHTITLTKKRNIKSLLIVLMLASLSAAIIDTIWAVYLDGFLHSEIKVGFFSAFLTTISFVSYFFIIPLIEKNEKKKLYAISLTLFILSYILFSLFTNFYIFAAIAVFITIVSTIRITSYGIMIKDNSEKNKLSKNEGIVYTFQNLSWVIGPLIAGFLISRINLRWMFVLAAILLSIGLFIFVNKDFAKETRRRKIDESFFKNFIDFFRKKERVLAYIVGGGVNLWWVLIYLFVPLEILRAGLNSSWIGYFLFAVVVPIVGFEYFFANKASKEGFKKYFILGYSLVGILSLITFFISNIYWIMGIMALASLGISMIEATSEAYFFDILNERTREEDRFYAPYNTAIDSMSFIGKVSASIALIFLSFKFLFILFGIFMFIFALISTRAKNITESRRK